MGACLWFLFFAVNGVAAFVHPSQLSSCRVLQKNAYCSDLNLTSVPPQLPPGIHMLDLSRNFLQNLTEDILSTYPTIRQLNFHSNRIQSIQPGLFRNMNHLQVLDLSRNQLHLYAALKTNVGPLTSVQKLDLSGNGLYTDMSDYFLRDAPALTNLSLNGNSITKIGKETFSGSLALRKIDLHNNVILEIEEGTFNSLQHLTELDLSMNSISCIEDFNLFPLTSLNLSKNSMTSFQCTDLDKEFELLYLDLSENKIHYFPILPYKNKIIHLDLSRNQLRSVNCTGAAEELQYLKDRQELTHAPRCSSNHHQELPRLRYLDLSYNHFTAVPSDFFNSMVDLETLNISNNCLGTFMVDTEGPLNALKTLDLSFNNLQNFTFCEGTLQGLRSLYLQGNYLSTLDFSRLHSITNLHLQLNTLHVCGSQDQPSGCVSFSSMPSLQYLYLSENNLISVPAHAFQGTPLLILDLSLNPGVKISEQALSGLENSLIYLSLRGDQLQTLKTDLSLLRSLRMVDLSRNQLTSLSLSRDSAIEILHLQNNSLEILEDHTLMALEGKLRTLHISMNPLSCCANTRLIDWVQQASVDIPDITMATCHYRKDAEYVKINLRNVKTEHCDTLNGKVFVISLIAVLVLGLMVVLLVAIKLCHSRSHRFNHSYRA
ncbi:transforming growth factor beta activator LRRC32 [Colossoma macropomum]|uniref:transforming growth factor beta activator LRRC32 n=1 Tax=Colossoma macropomum TaxID=42526 RepID=UPI0018649FA9|nr:transforming growth factor beta activator LRRC32 [Colossoma macropomum]XP_036451214.1 transforming growth factor beta activator LRRC32 [Colossoma macropomum]